jgi:two-component system, sensor histidine kinase
MSTVNTDRVLIVEQPDGRDMLKLALEEAGFEVDLAGTGEEGLVLAAARAPAVVISDIDLPTMNGWQLAAALRRTFGSDMRLVALTSRDDLEDRRRSLAAGFDAHLVKPVAPTRVHQELRLLLP